MQILVAIHGILTSQTDPSWPDKFDAWMFRRDPRVRVLKKEYRAGPFPRWNCWVKDPLLARGLTNEIELFLSNQQPPATSSNQPCRPWFIAHSNGAVIALLAAKRLVARGYLIGGLVLTGAACEADVEKNGVLAWSSAGALGAAIAYSSPDDAVLDGDADHSALSARPSLLRRLREFVWGKLMWPYGCLGRTGWLCRGAAFPAQPRIFTRWFAGGHCAYFTPENLERTFDQIYRDTVKSDCSDGPDESDRSDETVSA
jgi:hypothetical protein